MWGIFKTLYSRSTNTQSALQRLVGDFLWRKWEPLQLFENNQWDSMDAPSTERVTDRHTVNSVMSHNCAVRPMVYHPYPRRLESLLTIYRCHHKGSNFSSVTWRPSVLVRPRIWTCDRPHGWFIVNRSAVDYLTIIPRARMGSESIAHEAEGRMGYWLRGHEGERNNCFSKIQLVGQKNIETKHLSLVKARF